MMKKWAKVLIIMFSLCLMIGVMNIAERFEHKKTESNQSEVQTEEGGNSEENPAEEEESKGVLSKIHIGKTNIVALVIIGGILVAVKTREYKESNQDETDE